MAIHSKDEIREALLDDVYASADLSVVMPKYKMPEKEHAPRHAFSVVRDELMLDGNARQNLATGFEHCVGDSAHDPDAGAAIDQADSTGDQQGSQLSRRFQVGRVASGIGAAINTQSFHSESSRSQFRSAWLTRSRPDPSIRRCQGKVGPGSALRATVRRRSSEAVICSRSRSS